MITDASGKELHLGDTVTITARVDWRPNEPEVAFKDQLVKIHLTDGQVVWIEPKYVRKEETSC